MTCFVGISQLVQPHATQDGLEPVAVLEDAALLVREGEIVEVGRRADVDGAGADEVSLGDRAVVPGLVESHTHLVYAGDRIDEMGMRARGETYESIANAGGGIVRSVNALAAATEEELVVQSWPRLNTMLRRGVTTAEIKSGYGLEPKHELKQLRAIRRVAKHSPVQVAATVLAHIIPPARRDDRAGYVDTFIQDILGPAAADNLAQYCDVFVETGAFEPDEARRIAAAAEEASLGLKLHVDQLHDGDGAALAAELSALSADHLDHSNDAGLEALAAAGTIATILPGCALFLPSAPWPAARRLRDLGCQVAVATDCNPGSSMVSDLPLCATLAATNSGLSLEEALWAITRGGALALGLNDRGRLVPGERADFVVLGHRDWRALLYHPADAPIHSVLIAGEPV